MKPKLVHQEAMAASFMARQAMSEGDYASAFSHYKRAADLESKVADFYLDKPELEPTRSVIIRSAAFMNLKAGAVEQAQRYIFFGLLHFQEELIRSQLTHALELSVSLKNMSPQAAGQEFNYVNMLRQRSVHYIMEPTSKIFGHSVGMQMIKEFIESYLKSLRAYATSQFNRIFTVQSNQEKFEDELDNLINPLITNSAYGSFKFSIANDFLAREGENAALVALKSNVILKYHRDILTNPLTDSDIGSIKKEYSEEEISDIFKPLTKIKSHNSQYKIGYYDPEDFSKHYLERIINSQRKQLLPKAKATPEDIGELENLIVHKRSSRTGKVSKKTLFKSQTKSLDIDFSISAIEPKDERSVILNEEILLNLKFDSTKGFTISFDDFGLQVIDVEYHKALDAFHQAFYSKLRRLVRQEYRSDEERKEWKAISHLISDLNALK